MAIVVSTLKPLVNHVLFLTSEARAATGESGAWLPVDWIGATSREQALIWIPLLLVAVFFVRGVFLYFGQYLTIRSGAHVIRDLRLRLYESVAYQSLEFFQTHPTGLIVSRILNDVQRLQRFCTTGLAELVRVGVMVPSLLATAIYHDWRMSLVMIVALPLLGYPTLRLGMRLRRASTASQETMALMATRLSESVSGVKIVQGFGMERFEVERFRDATDRMLRADLKAGRAQSLSPAVMELIGAMIGAGLFYLAGLGIARGRLDPGDFTVVLFCLGLLFTSFRRLSSLYADSQHALAASVRVFEIWTASARSETCPTRSRCRRSRARSASTASDSATATTMCWAASISRFIRARRSRSSGDPVRARARWPTCCLASTTRRMGGC